MAQYLLADLFSLDPEIGIVLESRYEVRDKPVKLVAQRVPFVLFYFLEEAGYRRNQFLSGEGADDLVNIDRVEEILSQALEFLADQFGERPPRGVK